MENVYVLDTCIILGDPTLKDYKGKTVYIPIAVQRELDRQKTTEGDVGFKSRTFFRKLKELDDFSGISYNFHGVTILNPNDELEKIIPDNNLDMKKADDWFLVSTILDTDSYILHTADFSLYNLARIKRKNVEFINGQKQFSIADLYNGKFKVDVCYDLMEDYKKEGFIVWKGNPKPFPNQMVILNCNGYQLYGRYHASQNKVLPLFNGGKKVWGLKARNPEQEFLIDILLDPNVQIISVTSPAGTGKTCVSLACALHQVVEQRGAYHKVYIAKDCTPIDKWNYLGFTKGDTESKLEQHFMSYKSTLESLALDKNEREVNGEKILEGLMTFGQVELLDIASIRGVTFRNCIVLVDEFQSMNLDTAQAVVSRVGEGAKIIFMGDLLQQTVDKLPPDKSGLYAVAEWLKDVDNTAHISLKKVERSKIVEKVNEIFLKNIYGEV